MSTPTPRLAVHGLRVAVEDTEILHDFNLEIPAGAVHALMGRNGSGKTSLAHAIMGHPRYTILAGTVELDGEDLLQYPTFERARKGVFLGFQYPVAIPGVTVGTFLRNAVKAIHGERMDVRAFRDALYSTMDGLGIDRVFAGRHLNDGFSGGEKKRMEILQLLLLKPRLAILDESDSGLDIDALKVVAAAINQAVTQGTTVLLITHYQRLLSHIKPDVVHVMAKGHLVTSGGPELALELEESGYEGVLARYGVSV